MAKLPDYQSDFNAFAKKHRANAFAFAEFQKQGLPNRKNEDWKYTNVEKWLPQSLNLPDWSGGQLADLNVKSDFEYSIVLHNGFFREDLSNIPAAVSVRPFRKVKDALGHQSEAFHSELKRDSFYHLSEAFTYDGVVIEVKDGKVVEKVLEVIHVSDSDLFVPARVLVRCGRSSQVELIERFVSSGSDYHFSNVITEIFAEAGAVIKYAQVQEQNHQAFHIGHLNIVQNADSVVDVLTASLGGGLTRFNVNSRLLGRGANVALNSLYLVEGKQHTDLCSIIDHVVPRCESQQLAKGVLTGPSRAVFNGLIRIRPDAQKSNSSQLNKNLILDKKAEVDTRPQLLIDADDVKAAHGATVGQVSEEEVFYLQSRAISRSEAVRILAIGFADEVLFNFTSADIRAAVQKKTHEKFAGFQIQ